MRIFKIICFYFLDGVQSHSLPAEMLSLNQPLIHILDCELLTLIGFIL